MMIGTVALSRWATIVSGFRWVDAPSPFPEIFGGGLFLVLFGGFLYVVKRLGEKSRKEGYLGMASRASGFLEFGRVACLPTLIVGLLCVAVGLIGSLFGS